MKKMTFVLLIMLTIVATTTYGQATRQLNFGFVGASYDIPLGKNITIAPVASVDLDFDYITLGAKANYYFDTLLKLPNQWDVYGGAGAGFAVLLSDDINKSSELDLGLQIGGRWFWNEKWGVYVEFGGGNTSGGSGGVGLTMRL